MKKLLFFAPVLLGLGFLATKINYKHEILHQSCSPETLQYDEWAPYCAGIVLSSRITGKDCSLNVMKSQEDSATGYGYRQPVPDCFKEYTFTWNEEGLVAHPEKQNSFSIPKDRFTGGR